MIRGNLRTDRLKVFNSVCDKVQELFGDKYKVLMIEDPEAYLDGPAGPPSSSGREGASSGKGAAAAQQEPRVAFQVFTEATCCRCIALNVEVQQRVNDALLASIWEAVC